MNLCGGKDKNGVGGGFFQSLQQGVKSCSGEHVNFVDNIDFIMSLGRREIDFIAQVAHVIHTGV